METYVQLVQELQSSLNQETVKSLRAYGNRHRLYERKEEKMVLEIGRLCVKIAGRDAGKKCVIVDVLDNNYVLIDGETRRRKCNKLHLEPLKELIKIKKNASHDDVKKDFEKLGLNILETKSKKAAEKPKKQRTVKKTPAPKVAKKKKAVKETKAPSKKTEEKKETTKPKKAEGEKK